MHAKALRPERAQETEGSGVTRAEGGAGSEAEGRQGLGGSYCRVARPAMGTDQKARVRTEQEDHPEPVKYTRG